ncbi:peptidyl-prolyl cis-trans isomerase [Massilibacteroides sp.]|uniref:peptidyl-prolyl cis-trans isomerase n=1 Tax=Massilibacteroides sp. TaxID=2034766 RepID=UPI0026044B37|nr:peptidyl-prolyl cis-trans isomerase [Massilibacteroides sp.]MDD4514910.1 peptidyl-prolyl cis-trans isomerase [Massilibacteroides sp.]
MKICFPFIAFVFLLSSCKNNSSTEKDILVEMNGKTLSKSEVTEVVPKGISFEDSLLFAESYIRKWIKDELVYNVALKNLGDDAAEIDRLVDAYRRSLIRYRYQERLVTERLSVNIQESDKLTYFEENQDRFKLDNAIVKGLFLKIPVEAPGLSDVKKWYKSNNVESLEKIEKYSIQNASIYEYFYDRWIRFDDIIVNIPVTVSNVNTFLKSNKLVEVSDSSFCYLLNIEEYMLSGQVAPYDYAEPRIVEMLTNQKRKEFVEEIENELYKDAVRNGDVKFLSNRNER